MKRKLRIVAIAFGALLLLLVAALLTFPGLMIKSAVNTAGPTLLGVDVKLDEATFRLLRGNMTLKGLFVGNPEGFNTRSLCEVGTITLDIEPSSLRTDTIIINEVYIDKPVFTYQKSLLESNLSKLLKSLEGKDDGKEKKKEKEKKPEKTGGKKVIITKLTIKDPMVKLGIKGIPAGAPIPLPDIVMTDIGKEKGGASPVDVIKKIFSSVLSLTTKIAVNPVKGVLKGGASAVGFIKDAGVGLVTGNKDDSPDENKED